MNMWDRIILSLVIIAMVAVVVSNGQGAGAIQAIGQGIAKLVQNIVGEAKQ